jgi:hypothetical protein
MATCLVRGVCRGAAVDQVFVAGSKISVDVRIWVSDSPPVTSTRPSARGVAV